MKKYFSALCAGLVVAGALSGCSDDDFGNGQNGSASAGEKVNFTLGGPSSRTVYDDEDEYQINWTDDDKVRIYCDEAEDVKQADYSVLKSETEESEGKLQYNENGLAWGGMNEHHFYAVYPADDSKVSMSNGIATFQVNQNQICTFGDAVNGNYMGDPDMTNAYMVASLSTEPVDEVALNFKPIMTTLEITLRGRENPNENQSYIAVTGLSIIRNASPNEVDKGFQYDIKKGKMVEEDRSSSQTIFVGVSHEGEAYLDLQAGESMTFTVFLPPMDINGDNPIVIRPNVAGNAELTVTVKGQDTNNGPLVFNASSKGKLTLPAWPAEGITGNNWITPLDNNIYVQQLSIPGTHDAAAYSTTVLDAGRTQALNFEEQWNIGIRAFDLRAAWRNLNGMWLWHGITITDVSLNDALSTLATQLKNNPGEFAILQLRHEDESLPLIKDTSRWNEVYDVLNNYSSMIVEWKPDLTIGECRGKFIILTRNDYIGRKNAGLISNWPENDSGVAQINSLTNYYVQDFYQYFSGVISHDGTEKIEHFNDLMATTVQFCNPQSEYFANKSWALNHTSAYDALIGGTNGYMQNAQNVVREIYRDVVELQTPGPLGIIFQDYVGQRMSPSWGGLSVFVMYGDLLTQAIIDNNYKYYMLRKQ